MMRTPSGMKMLTRLMFRLLPVRFFWPRSGRSTASNSTPSAVYRMARKVEYQNILGLNVLTIRI